MDIRKLQRTIVDALEDVKAQDIKVFNTSHLTELFDRVIIASGTSNRQTKALASSVREKVKESGGEIISTEGEDIGSPETLARLAAAAGLDAATVEAYLAGAEDDDTIRAEDAFARQIGINGVPCFIIDRQYAISGAQPAEAFVEVFDLARKGGGEEAEIV